MWCRKHLYDVSSSVGICASCLRERLSALIDAQAHMGSAAFENLQKQHSPYIFECDLDDAAAKHQWMIPDRRIFSTPQFEFASASKTRKEHTSTITSRVSVNRFITNLFKSKSQNFNNKKINREDQLGAPTSISVTSPRWFPSLRRKSKFNQSPTDQTPFPTRRIGISPNMKSCDTTSRYPRKKTPNSYASSKRSKSTSNFTGMIFGLSPLLQPTPISLQSHNSYTSETAFGSFSAELRALPKTTMSTSSSSSLRGSRSRKLADFGTINPSR